jgi:hypothetical protein
MLNVLIIGPNNYTIRAEFEFMKYDVIMTVNVRAYCLLGREALLATEHVPMVRKKPLSPPSFYLEDRDTTFFRNIGTNLTDHMMP